MPLCYAAPSRVALSAPPWSEPGFGSYARSKEGRGASPPRATEASPDGDRQGPIADFRKRLRQQLLEGGASPGQSRGSEDIFNDLFATAPVTTKKGSSHFKGAVSLPELSDPSSRMPCLGRHPIAASGVTDDEISPTFRRVREVCNRRDATEALLEEKQQELARSSTINTFKAQEQQRERELQVMRQKEFQRMRTIDFEARKQLADQLQRRRLELKLAESSKKMVRATEKAEDKLEEKRQKAAASLELWRYGCERAEKHKRMMDRIARSSGLAKQEISVQRHAKVTQANQPASELQFQKDERMKANVQASLKEQLAEKARKDNAERAEALEARLEAAARRRQQALFGSRYNLLERAFGGDAVGFDAKNHSISVDRRSDSWKKAMQERDPVLGRLQGEVASLASSMSGPLSPEKLSGVA